MKEKPFWIFIRILELNREKRIIKIFFYFYTNISSWSSKGFRHSLNSIFMTLYVHHRNSWYFPNSSLEVLIACSHNETPMLLHSVDNTIICICSFVIASESLETGILAQLQRQAPLLPQFLQFCYNTIRYVGDTFYY